MDNPQSDSGGAKSAPPPERIEKEDTRTFERSYQKYIGALTSLRTFASDLDPAVQESARKANLLIGEATERLAKSWGFSSTDELKELRNSQEAGERIRAATKEDPKAVRSAALVSLRLMERAVRYYPHEQIMRRGVLMSLIGAFEVLLSDLVHLFYDRYPAALESSEERKYSFKEIRSFESPERFLEHVIDNKVDDFLRGSLMDWVDFFNKRKIDVTKFAPSWESFAECFQRRHVIVHNGGRVSRQYLQHVDPNWIEEHKDEARLGQVLRLSNEYLLRAFDYFELVGSLLCLEC
jgi:hypothetical protein